MPALEQAASIVGPATTPTLPSVDEATRRSRETAEQIRPAYEKVSDVAAEGPAALERDVADYEKESARLAEMRKGARPDPLSLAPAPSSTARAFLEPGTSLLSQLNAAVLAIGQIGLQSAGLRGSAVGALSAMRGMSEGWAAGDAERVKRSYAEWDANTKRLIEQHRAQTEAYREMLADHTMTMNERLNALKLRADIAGNKVLAEKLRTIDPLNATLDQFRHEETVAAKMSATHDAAAKWWARQASIENAQRLGELTTRTKQILRSRDIDPLKATAEQIDAAVKQEAREDREKHVAALEEADQMAQRREDRKEKAIEKKAQVKREGAMKDLDRLGTIIDRMDGKGLLPKAGATLGGMTLSKWNREWLNPTDPDFIAFVGVFSPIMVGEIDRSLFDEKGVRAVQMFRKQFDMMEKIPSAEAVHALLNELKGSVRDKMKEASGTATPDSRDPLGILR